MGIEKIRGYLSEQPGWQAHVSLLRYELQLRNIAPGISISMADIYHAFYSVFHDPKWGSDFNDIEFPLEIDHLRHSLEVKPPWILSLRAGIVIKPTTNAKD